MMRSLQPPKVMFFALIAALFSFYASVSEVAAAPRGERVERGERVDYLGMLSSSSRVVRTTAAKEITRAESAEPAVYKKIESILLRGYDFEPPHFEKEEELAWMCKALATSGDFKYKKTLEIVAHESLSKKLRKYAFESIDKLAYYKERRAMSRESRPSQKGLSPQHAAIIKKLKSHNLQLQKEAAQMLTDGTVVDATPALYNLVEENLRKDYMTLSRDPELIDTLAWYCRALGASGMSKYRGILEKVNSGAPSPKLRKYARRALENLRRSR